MVKERKKPMVDLGVITADYEQDVRDLFPDAHGALFVDVGAHKGLWALAMASRFRHVRAFEADAETCAVLRNNVADMANVEVTCAAVSDTPGFAYLRKYGEGHGAIVNRAAPYEYTQVERVVAVTLDDVLGDVEGDMFLKIDVEGAETLVLAGASKLLRKVRWLCVETHGVAEEEQVKAQCRAAGLDVKLWPPSYYVHGSRL
jgi:FkbM family methyltransferase